MNYLGALRCLGGCVRGLGCSVTAIDADVSTYCTFAVTDALPFKVNLHVLVLFPPLEQAPDQIASRPLVTLNVIEVPVLKDVEPVVPTATLIPAGLDVTRSPLRPVAVTDNVAVCAGGFGGFTVSVVDRVSPPYTAEIVTGVAAPTVVVVAVNVALVAPPATVMLAGTAAALLLLESATAAPPCGAAADRMTVPCEDDPPMTLWGLTDTLCSVADGGGGGGGGAPPGLTVNVAVRVLPLG
jgi:hypothetical protein